VRMGGRRGGRRQLGRWSRWRTEEEDRCRGEEREEEDGFGERREEREEIMCRYLSLRTCAD